MYVCTYVRMYMNVFTVDVDGYIVYTVHCFWQIIVCVREYCLCICIHMCVCGGGGGVCMSYL